MTTAMAEPQQVDATGGRDGTWLYLTEAASSDLNALHDVASLSVVHYAASVADRTMPQAAIGVLKAMGKDENVTGMRMHPSDSVNALPVWMAAHQTRFVVLSRVQSWQSQRILTELLRLLAATPATVIVATEPGVSNRVGEALRGFGPATVSEAEVSDLVPAPWRSPIGDEQESDVTPGRVMAPVADWPTFRHECRATLPAAAFDRLDAEYVTTFKSARDRLQRDAPTDESTLDLITDILRDSIDAAAATTAFRATQAAYFTAGYNLRLDPTRLITLYGYTRPPAFTRRDWLALRAYKDPARPATCALYAHGLTVDQISDYTVGDAETAVTTGALNGRPLDPDAAVFLEANLIHRGIHGAEAHEPFIPLISVARVLTDAGKDVGVLTAGKPIHTSRHTKAIWTAGTGFLLKSIHDTQFAGRTS